MIGYNVLQILLRRNDTCSYFKACACITLSISQKLVTVTRGSIAYATLGYSACCRPIVKGHSLVRRQQPSCLADEPPTARSEVAETCGPRS